MNMPKINKTAKSQTPQDRSVVARLENQLKRALADYHNLERRVDEERRLLAQLSSAILIEKFLPVLDNLENAQKHLKDEGLEMVIKQFKNVLSEEGVEEIVAEGAQFNPHFHEATELVEGQKDGLVVKVLRKGYKIDSKVLRAAQVAVGSNKGEKKVAVKDEPRSSDDEREEMFKN